MKKITFGCIILVLIFSCKKEISTTPNNGTVPRTVTEIDYYVNGGSGSDANTGTSAAHPLKTIQAALNKTTEGGYSTIYVAGGTYGERLVWPHSGASEDERITLTNYNDGVVILDGSLTTSSTQNAMIEVTSKSYLTIENINIINNIRNDAYGIYIHGSGTFVDVTDCKIHHIGWTTDSTAVPTSTQNAHPFLLIGSTTASYNEVYVGSNEIYSCNTGYSEALTMNGNVEVFLIELNTVHHIRNIGIDVAGHYSWTGAPAASNYVRDGNIKYNTVYNCVSNVATNGGIYADGASYVNIEGNICHDNYAGITVGCENNGFTAQHIRVSSNFVYNNKDAAIIIGSNQASSKVTYSSVNNNTFFKNFTNGGYGGEISLQNTDHLSIQSNIVQSASNIVVIALLGYTSTNLSMDYNRYYTLSGSSGTITFDWGGINGGGYYSLATFQSGTGLDAHSTYGTPSFVNSTLATLNLHLTSGSACVNAGYPSYVVDTNDDETDVDQQNRVQNSRIDIGADETPY